MDTLNTPPAGDNEAGTPEGPSKLLAELNARATEGSPVERPPQLTLNQIKRAPELFQPRGLKEDERHILELARAIKNCGLLDPVLVMQIGPDAYLIDGHHRLLAYNMRV